MQFGLENKIIEQINSVFKQYPGIQRVVIYGSRAKGNWRNGSDIDLAIIAPEMTTEDLIKIKTQIDDLPIAYNVDLSLFHYIDNQSLINHIQRIGKEFYSRQINKE